MIAGTREEEKDMESNVYVGDGGSGGSPKWITEQHIP